MTSSEGASFTMSFKRTIARAVSAVCPQTKESLFCPRNPDLNRLRKGLITALLVPKRRAHEKKCELDKWSIRVESGR